MTNTTHLKRAAGLASLLGATAAVASIPSTAAAAPTEYATGWQCISPFIQTFAGAATPDGFLDSLDISVGRGAGNALTAVKGQPLYLDSTQLSLEFKNPGPLKSLWSRTGGVGLTYTGSPGWANDGNGAAQLLTGSDPKPASTNITLRVKAADGLTYWSYATGTSPNQVIHYAPTPVSASVLKGLSALPVPTAYPGESLTSTSRLSEQYLGNRNNNNYPLSAYVTLEATNTVERFQTVHVDGTWTVNVQDPTPGSSTWLGGYTNGDETVTAPKRTYTLPSSKWTPTGDGPVEFRIAPPGNSAPVIAESKGYDRDGYNRPIKVVPFGSVFVRADTKSYGSSNDCVNGTISVKDSTISAAGVAGFIGNASPTAGDPSLALLGDAEFPGFTLANSGGAKNPIKGVAGRYATTQAVQPTFAKADLPAAPAPTPVPVPVTTPAPAPAGPVVLSADVLGVKSKKTTVSVTNTTTASNEYTISATTKNAYKSGKSKKKLKVAPDAKTTVAAGKTNEIKLSVTKAVRDLLRSKSITVVLTVTPKGGTATTSTVTLTEL
ncbi:MAG: hypothetical protein PGN13_15645 [Patulibacter minatonensis]